VCALCATAVAAGGCGGGGSAGPTSFERVHFFATDGVRLDGRLFGDGKVGVVLTHMGRPGDTQRDWLGLARTLAAKDYRVLTYNRRGVCPGGPAGCSGGIDEYDNDWKDVVGAAKFLRQRKAEQIVLAGASIGAMASLYAASQGRVRPVALIEFAGINNASGYAFGRPDIARIRGAKLFLSARHDVYGGGPAPREWYRWATPPKRLELVPGTDHGTDLLGPGNPQHARVLALIVDFLEQAAPAH